MHSSDLNAMLDAVLAYHEKKGIEIGTESRETMLYRMNLLLQKLGELSKSILDGKADIADKHGELFMILLGNCITMNIDPIESFWKIYEEYMGNSTEDTQKLAEWEFDIEE